jgi:uncharacterized protein
MNFSGAKIYIQKRLQEEIPSVFSYHNFQHIMDVYEAAERIAHEEGVTGEELDLLLIAVLFHDSGFLMDRVDHELLSCEIVSRHLPDFDFLPNEIDRILGLIMATKIPQKPKNKLEEIICDADLDYLGRNDFWEIGDKLFNELKAIGLISTRDDWNKKQLSFLEAHTYFTKSSQNLRNATKLLNIGEVKNRIQN